MFDENVLTAKFGAAGNLETFDYIIEAQAEAVSASFTQTVGATGQIVDAQRDAEIVKLQRKLDRINLEVQLIEAQNKRDAL